MADEPIKAARKRAQAGFDATYKSLDMERLRRMVNNLYQQGEIFQMKGDALHAYIAYLRSAMIYMDCMKAHPGFTSTDKADFQGKAKTALDRVDDLEKVLRKQYAERPKPAPSVSAPGKDVVLQPQPNQPSSGILPSTALPAAVLPPSAPWSPTSVVAPVPAATKGISIRPSGDYPDLDAPPPFAPQSADDASLVELQHWAGPSVAAAPVIAPSPLAPVIPPKPSQLTDGNAAGSPGLAPSVSPFYDASRGIPAVASNSVNSTLGSTPAAVSGAAAGAATGAAPFVPPKPSAYVLNPTPPPKPVALQQQPKPSTLNDPGAARGQMRDVVIPGELLQHFLALAKPNTLRNLETCGILCGKATRERLAVSHLLVPQQTATSDTCSTRNEEELLMYQEANDIIAVGWIHTHPTQRCFMSSVDLHTHCSYQLMLPEAIAIVCAPSAQPSVGIFRLTDPQGLDILAQCSASGFHPHPYDESVLYCEVSGNGRVSTAPIPLVCRDFRT